MSSQNCSTALALSVSDVKRGKTPPVDFCTTGSNALLVVLGDLDRAVDELGLVVGARPLAGMMEDDRDDDTGELLGGALDACPPSIMFLGS